MAKSRGQIGFAKSVEDPPGVWKEKLSKKYYYIEEVRSARRLQTIDQVNDNVVLNNTFSIVADPFASKNFHSIRTIKWKGTVWKVTNVEVQYPRLILTIGGVYNGKN